MIELIMILILPLKRFIFSLQSCIFVSTLKLLINRGCEIVVGGHSHVQNVINTELLLTGGSLFVINL